MRKRNVKKQIWLNEEEARLLKDKSSKTGLNDSDLIRMIIRDYQLKEKPDIEFYNILKNLRGIGTNINQIAHIANEFKYIDEKRLQVQLNNLNDFIEQIKDKYLRLNKK